MKVLYSGFVDHNHSKFGGYDNIIRFPETDKVILSNNCFLGEINKKYRLRKIPLSICDIKTRLSKNQFDICHLFYGEITMIPFIPYSKSKKCKNVITLHLDITKQRFHKSFIRNLNSFDGKIVLSSQQKEYYSSQFGIETTFIPHGFDKPIFNETVLTDRDGKGFDFEAINLVTSGSNYRDYDTLLEAVSCLKDDDKFIFHLVGTNSIWKNKFEPYPNVRIYNRLDDDSYYSLIKFCDYNFLPVTFATANNALLEAQSIGISSILPKIPGILDYAAPQPFNYFYANTSELIQIIKSLSKSTISQDIINHSKKFYWESIYKQLYDYYIELINYESHTNNILSNNEKISLNTSKL